MFASIVAVSLAVVAVNPSNYLEAYSDRDSLLATEAPYPSGIADDAHRPGFNGREWSSRAIIGPGHGPYMEPGSNGDAERYGAYGDEFQSVYVRVGHTMVSFSPWTAIPNEGLQRLERGRNEWLKEQGYVGGVRTFRNDLHAGDGPATFSTLPEPRATIRFIDGVPMKKPTPVVEREPAVPAGLAAALRSGEGVHVSLPPSASLDLVAQCQERGWIAVRTARATR